MSRSGASARAVMMCFGALLWCASLVATPLAVDGPTADRSPTRGTGQVAGLTRYAHLFFGKICHQDPARSFAIGGAQMPVCGRCAGIYFGFLFGVAGLSLLARKVSAAGRASASDRLLSRPSFLWTTAAAPMALDVLLEAVGAGGIAGVAADPVWGNIVRAATGLWFGTWAGIILGAAIGRPEAARAAGATPVSVSGQRTRDLPGMPAEGRSAS